MITETEVEGFGYHDIGLIVYNLTMIVLIVFMMIQCYKMEKLHRERKDIVKELDELLSNVKAHRDLAESLIKEMKKKLDDEKADS